LTTNTRQAKRTPVTLKITFKSETLQQFIQRYSVDISGGGIFIRTREPLPVGTTLRFEFQLRDASPLITGDGTVVWLRQANPERPGVAPGMGVRFDKLTPKSRQVLNKILSDKAHGARPTPPPAAEEPDPAEATRVAPKGVLDDLAKHSVRANADSDDTPLPSPIPFHASGDELRAAQEEATAVRLRGFVDEGDVFDEPDGPVKTQHDIELLEIDKAFLKPERKEVPALPSIGQGKGRNRDVRATEPTPVPDMGQPQAAGRSRTKPDTKTSMGPAPMPPKAKGDGPGVRPPDTAASMPSGKASKRIALHERDEGSKLISLSLMDEPPDSLSDRDPIDPKALGAADPSEVRRAAPELEDEDEEAEIERYRVEQEEKKRVARERAVKTIVEAAQDPRRQAAKQMFLSKQAEIAGHDPEVVAQAPTPELTTRRLPGLWIAAGVAMACITIASIIIVVVRAGGEKADPPPKTETENPTTPVADAKGALVVDVKPKGARVEVLGTGKYGSAPMEFKGLKDNGTYKIRVDHAGYKSREIVVTASATDREPVVVKLAPLPRMLSVTTTPPGAKIIVSDIELPYTTPAEFELSGDLATNAELSIVLKKPGFTPVYVPVEVNTTFRERDGVMHLSLDETLRRER